MSYHDASTFQPIHCIQYMNFIDDTAVAGKYQNQG